MKNLLVLASLLLSLNIAYADQNIVIVGGNNAANPKIAVVAIPGDVTGENNAAEIITDDLNITGEFTAIKYPNLKAVSQDVKYIIQGNLVNPKQISFTLSNNTESKTILLQQQITSPNGDSRKLAHSISNAVYQQLTGIPGIFTTRIAYVAKYMDQGHPLYKIVISDYDGYNPQVVTQSTTPLSSLAWNFDNSKIAYMTLESKKPTVYVQYLNKPERYKVADFPGSNSSPAFMPNNKQLAVTLSKDYGSHVYIVDDKPYKPNKSTASPLIRYGSNIDTEAAISKTGDTVFTSDHDGGPQIFTTNLQNPGDINRLTIGLGSYNTTPRLSHDLQKLTFINRNNGVLTTYVMDLKTHTAYPISQHTGSDISPSFAPNDKLVLFSSNGNAYLANTTGTTQTRLNKVMANEIIDQRWANDY